MRTMDKIILSRMCMLTIGDENKRGRQNMGLMLEAHNNNFTDILPSQKYAIMLKAILLMLTVEERGKEQMEEEKTKEECKDEEGKKGKEGQLMEEQMYRIIRKMKTETTFKVSGAFQGDIGTKTIASTMKEAFNDMESNYVVGSFLNIGEWRNNKMKSRFWSKKLLAKHFHRMNREETTFYLNMFESNERNTMEMMKDTYQKMRISPDQYNQTKAQCTEEGNMT